MEEIGRINDKAKTRKSSLKIIKSLMKSVPKTDGMLTLSIKKMGSYWKNRMNIQSTVSQ